jgi:hypothetical protein
MSAQTPNRLLMDSSETTGGVYKRSGSIARKYFYCACLKDKHTSLLAWVQARAFQIVHAKVDFRMNLVNGPKVLLGPIGQWFDCSIAFLKAGSLTILFV